MGLSKHPGHEISGLIKPLKHFILTRVLMNRVYKRIQDTSIIFLVLYLDDILLIENDVEVLSNVKGWLKNQF